MATLGPAAFAALVWGAVAGVSLLVLYQAYAIAAEFGWLGG